MYSSITMIARIRGGVYSIFRLLLVVLVFEQNLPTFRAYNQGVVEVFCLYMYEYYSLLVKLPC